MNAIATWTQDVMLVCRNGHVITDRLYGCPERGLSHCDRCGAEAITHCSTCGQPLAGGWQVPGLVPLGRSSPPRFCSNCGRPFPWIEVPPAGNRSELLHLLEMMLRRLPRVIRALRFRHGDRQPFRIADEHDLEDLLRALLPLAFDDVRPEVRTPPYSAGSRTDFRLATGTTAGFVALMAKHPRRDLTVQSLLAQFREDARYYADWEECRALVGLVLDREGILRDPRELETACAKTSDRLDVRCVIAS
jgi:hypothetical protein